MQAWECRLARAAPLDTLQIYTLFRRLKSKFDKSVQQTVCLPHAPPTRQPLKAKLYSSILLALVRSATGSPHFRGEPLKEEVFFALLLLCYAFTMLCYAMLCVPRYIKTRFKAINVTFMPVFYVFSLFSPFFDCVFRRDNLARFSPFLYCFFSLTLLFFPLRCCFFVSSMLLFHLFDATFSSLRVMNLERYSSVLR